MNIWFLLLILIIIIIVSYFIKNKIVFRFDTLFRKGFARKKDMYGVYVFCGKQGSGKTLSVIDFIESTRSKTQKVITNVKSYALNHKDYCIYEDNFYNIIKGFNNGTYNSDYIIFFDEIFTLLEKGKLDKSILTFISQLRKRCVYLVSTAQEWLEINVTFRRYCRYQIDCSLFNLPIFNCCFSINEINDGYNMKWDNLQNEYVSPRLKTTIKKCSLKIANSYDTFEVIKDS